MYTEAYMNSLAEVVDWKTELMPLEKVEIISNMPILAIYWHRNDVFMD